MRKKIQKNIKVKICGITNLADALNAADLGADALGFIFAQSPRQITPDQAAKIIKKIPPFVSKVGVFVNNSRKEILSILNKCPLDVLQFHGEETDNYCAFFRKYCKIIKAVRVINKTSLGILKKYSNIDAFLFDTFKKGIYGGTGESFDWKILKNIKTKVPVIISGGLNLNNLKTAIKLTRPYGVDICSGVETRAGKKNIKLIAQIIEFIQKQQLNT
ncbi:MAG: phosphoribosylanthranilate isomerase [Candidatus Omnitrophota bacterium]